MRDAIGILYNGLAGSNWLKNQSRCCSSDKGTGPLPCRRGMVVSPPLFAAAPPPLSHFASNACFAVDNPVDWAAVAGLLTSFVEVRIAVVTLSGTLFIKAQSLLISVRYGVRYELSLLWVVKPRSAGGMPVGLTNVCADFSCGSESSTGDYLARYRRLHEVVF